MDRRTGRKRPLLAVQPHVWRGGPLAAAGMAVAAAVAVAGTVMSGTFGSRHGSVTTVQLAAGSAALAAMMSFTLLFLFAFTPVADRPAEVPLEEQLVQLSASMRDSAKLVEQVSAELAARAAVAARLKAEAETAEAVARLHQAETDAVRRILDAELEGQARKIRRDALWIGMAAFIAGSGVTYLVTLLVHPLH